MGEKERKAEQEVTLKEDEEMMAGKRVEGV